MELNPKNIAELLSVISWQKIIQTAVLISIFMVSWVVWENRVVIYNSIRVGATVESSDPLVIHISNQTKDYIASTVKSGTGPIVGIQIINVNFRKNSRSTAHFFIRNESLRKDFEAYTSSKIVDTPLFNESESNNQRMINLINGDFVCTEYANTIGPRIFPNTVNDITTLCSVSIPPYYGRFSGYMNIYMASVPTATDLVFIKQLSRDISLRVYEYDINRPDPLTVK